MAERAWRDGSVWLLTALLSGLAVMLWLAHPDLPALDPHVPWWVLIPLFALGERLAVFIPVGRDAHALSFTEIPLVVAMLFATPGETLIARGVGTAIVFVAFRRMPPIKLAFNVASYAAQTLVALTVFGHLVGRADALTPYGWLAVVLAVMAAETVGTATIMLVLTLNGQHPTTHPLVSLAIALGTALVNVDLGLIAALLISRDSVAALLLVLLVALCFLLYRGYHLERQRHARLEALYEFTRAVEGALQDGAVVPMLLHETAAVLRAQRADVLMVGVDGSLHAVDDPGLDSQTWWRPAAAGQLVRYPQPRVGGQHASLAGTAHGDAMAAPLRGDAGLIGVLVVTDRVDRVSTYDRDDEKLFEALAGHSAVVLANDALVQRVRAEALAKEHLALHDPLTGLPNRVAFLDALEGRLADTGRAGVLLMDLDDFREVNDTLGHAAGDDLLRAVARRLDGVSGESHLVARLGGDEFAVLLAGERDVDATVDRLLSEIRRPVPVGGVDLSVDASLGIAVAPDDGATAPVLLRRAEVAMYDAKAGALGVARYTASRDPYSARRLSLVTDLARSLEEGALSLHYQPQARPSDGQVVACEALLRWDHPVWGRVPPDEFVPLAERTSLMRPLTQFVVEQSIAEAVRWQRAGLPVAIAVNVSVRNVLEPDFADRIARLLVQAALPAELFKLEITETQLMEDGPRTLGTLADLVDLGIEVSIDDFGIGYSSLIRLRTLPVSEVKVDRSFVRGLPNDASDLAVVRAVVDLGHDLGLRVVAEGVETNAAWRTLDELGCDLIQGYALARPMAADDATAWLTDHFASRVARMRRQPDETSSEETRGGSAGRWLAP